MRLICVLLALLLVGCVPSATKQVKTPKFRQIWSASRAVKVSDEGNREVWSMKIRNKLHEPVFVRIDLFAYTDDDQLAGFFTDCKTIEALKEIEVEMPITMPTVLKENRLAYRTEVKLEGSWLGDFGAGLKTCDLVKIE